MANIKLKAQQSVQVWNLLSRMYELSDNPTFTSWVKRMMWKMEPEIKFWNSLSQEEREAVKDKEIQYSVEKLPAKELPEPITGEVKEVLKDCVDGEIQVYKSQLEKALNGKAKKKDNA